MQAAFRTNASKLHIRTKFISIKSGYRVTGAECYHAPICRATDVIEKKFSMMGNDEKVEMAVKTKNVFFKLDALVPNY